MPDSSSQPSLIVGLGNPETRYEETRHNVGFQVIDRILAAVPARSVQEQRARNYIFWACRLAGRQLWLQKPLTYMNCSGDACTPGNASPKLNILTKSFKATFENDGHKAVVSCKGGTCTAKKKK